jgi:rSAM/selenodomain-associated transferase 1
LSAALIIFIKNPVKGVVKTRIARAVGDDVALSIYLQLCSLTRQVALNFSGTKYLFYSDEVVHDDEWKPEQFSKLVQHGSDLGERMFNAFNSVFQQHDKIILIGSDCPYLNLNHMKQAIQKLNEVDCVLGPAQDGGYYLIGLRIMITELFTDKSWSHANVLNQSINTLNERNHSFTLLDTLEDIDELEDWERYLNKAVQDADD